MAVYRAGMPRSSSLLFKRAITWAGCCPVLWMPLTVITRRIHGRRRALTGNVADVHANHAVGEREIIQVIATDEGGRLKFVGA